MTKEQYLEMCEMMQQDPVPEHMPVEISDLPYDAQLAYSIFVSLNDNWEGMSGSYLGKQLQGISEIMDIMGIEDKKETLEIISLIDACRKDHFSKQQKIKQNQKTATKD